MDSGRAKPRKAESMAYETIIVEVEDHVATITLNRPDALNALNALCEKEMQGGHGKSRSRSSVTYARA